MLATQTHGLSNEFWAASDWHCADLFVVHACMSWLRCNCICGLVNMMNSWSCLDKLQANSVLWAIKFNDEPRQLCAG